MFSGNFLRLVLVPRLKPAILVAAVVAVISICIPNYYRSEARFLPVESRMPSGLGQLAATAAALGFGMPGQDGTDSNYVDIIRSRWLRESLLNSEFEFTEPGRLWSKDKHYKTTLLAYLKARDIDAGVGKVGKIVSGSKDIKTRMLVLSAETRSPELSRQLVLRATSLLEDFLITKGRTRGGAKAVFAAARLEDARQELARSEIAFKNFLQGNRNYSTSADPVTRVEGLRLEADLKMRQQMVVSLTLNHEQALMEEKNDMPILNVLDPGNLPIEKSWPSRSLFVLAGFVAGLLGGIAWSRRQWLWASLTNFKEA